MVPVCVGTRASERRALHLRLRVRDQGGLSPGSTGRDQGEQVLSGELEFDEVERLHHQRGHHHHEQNGAQEPHSAVKAGAAAAAAAQAAVSAHGGRWQACKQPGVASLRDCDRASDGACATRASDLPSGTDRNILRRAERSNCD